jgi:hypothetical protein
MQPKLELHTFSGDRRTLRSHFRICGNCCLNSHLSWRPHVILSRGPAAGVTCGHTLIDVGNPATGHQNRPVPNPPMHVGPLSRLPRRVQRFQVKESSVFAKAQHTPSRSRAAAIVVETSRAAAIAVKTSQFRIATSPALHQPFSVPASRFVGGCTVARAACGQVERPCHDRRCAAVAGQSQDTTP